MRLNSISEKPSSTAARRRVTYLSSCVFISAPSRRKKNHGIFFNNQDHGLIDVHVPAFSDAHAHGFTAILQQFPAQRHLDLAKRHLQDHRLPDPYFERALHSSPSQWFSLTKERIAQRGAGGNGTERSAD